MAVPLSLRGRLERKLPRVAKAARQWMRVAVAGRRPDTRVVFVVGSQRSGTRLPMQVMDCSRDIATFTEGSAPYFRDVLLEPLNRVEALVRRSPAPIVALKPICETHRVVELLTRFPGSRAVWIFRNYQAAVNSASIKWRSGREAVRRLAAGELDLAGWRAGGLTAPKLELVKRLYRDDMSLHEANAVMWYLRNDLFFGLGADTRPDVLLVRYEDLVSDPLHVERMFQFIGAATPRDFQRGIARSSRPKPAFPEIAREITVLCEDLQARLLSHYTGQARTLPLPAAAPAEDRALAVR